MTHNIFKELKSEFRLTSFTINTRIASYFPLPESSYQSAAASQGVTALGRWPDYGRMAGVFILSLRTGVHLARFSVIRSVSSGVGGTILGVKGNTRRLCFDRYLLSRSDYSCSGELNDTVVILGFLGQLLRCGAAAREKPSNTRLRSAFCSVIEDDYLLLHQPSNKSIIILGTHPIQVRAYKLYTQGVSSTLSPGKVRNQHGRKKVNRLDSLSCIRCVYTAS